MESNISFTLNGKEVVIKTDPLRRLVDILREDFKLKGTKEGCGEGECGACAIIIDDKLINSCLIPIGTIEGSNITTMEGYRETERFKVLQESFEKAGSVQCGFCTPGMIMATEALLRKNPKPNEEEIRDALSGNLCRCTGYNMIIEGVKTAIKIGEGLW
ncbi:(2Fe-2S)-binding protein [Tepidibacter aestuarii]|uniref:(2Fe-2S)-binding protein n=1 Tax=Tepidibacter aestuarii TaxID=2925782 RepID=UPI0020BE316A|nr:(2Fe-2S)-binding protein [Tepidibacter aestuarii]CAH2213753.1 putative xanthine dehydrogenase iron-sulfur-binding subunit XdhC [Tepidibacter aestuarii]